MLLDAVCAVDGDGRLVFVNPAYEMLLGYSRDDLLGRRMMDFVHPDDRAFTIEAARRVMQGIDLRDFRNRYIRRDGAVLHLVWSARWSSEEGVRIAVARDVTTLVREEALNAIALEISQTAFEHESPDSMWTCVESAFARHIGSDAPVALATTAGRTERLGSAWGNDRALDTLALPAIPGAGGGGVSWGRWQFTPFNVDSIDGWLGLARTPTPRIDMDEPGLRFLGAQVGGLLRLKALAQQLREAALHDPLTGVANRRLLTDRAHLAVERATRGRHGFGLLFVDVDGFKTINDRFGHARGDEVLVEVARELERHVRATDTVARLGGDEFVILIDGPIENGQIERVSRGLVARLDDKSAATLPSFSVGLARFPDDGSTFEELLAAADRDMYRAKAEPSALSPSEV